MKIAEYRRGEVVVVSLSGRLDAGGAPVLEARLDAIAGRGDRRLVLDCAQVSYIASRGLRALLSSTRACRGAGGTLVLAALRPQCREVVVMSGFGTFIDCHETLEEAIAALGRAAAEPKSGT